MNYWFFFSYAHADQNDYLKKFYDDLAESVRSLTGVAAPESGFIDRKDIEHGSQWDNVLVEALQSCRVFIPIYSASYFLSEYCGKEFKVFRDRLDAHSRAQTSATVAPLILPVLWTPESHLLKRIPAAINNIQFSHGDYPTEYLSEGLLQLVRLGSSPGTDYYLLYWKFVSAFASAIVDRAAAHQLPALPSMPSIDKVDGLFSPATRAAVTTATADETGPRYVQFIFVAANESELKARRKVLKFYGPKGGSDWKPYLDAYQGNAAALAIEAVGNIKDMHYEEITLSAGIVEHIKQAASQSKIVVVVVDTWTLRLESYNQLVAPLDEFSSMNCITLILWNNEDLETDTKKTTLEAIVEGTFRTKLALTDRNFFPNSIKSSEDFKTELSRALAQAQLKIANTAKVQQRMEYALMKTAL